MPLLPTDVTWVDYKDITLRTFVYDRGKIRSHS